MTTPAEPSSRPPLIGSTMIYRDEVDSTQNVVREAARRGAAEGYVVVAGRQTAGRGRLGRDWWSPSDGGLYLSMLLRPQLDPGNLAWITMSVALGAAEAIEAVCDVQPELKWPNDLTWGGRKLAGVLAEAAFVDGRTDYVIAGIGLNAQVDFSQRPDLAAQAVSLHAITGRPVDRQHLLAELLARVDRYYRGVQHGVSPQPRWTGRLATLGQSVTLTTSAGETLSGVAERVEPDGRLVLRLLDGCSLAVSAGDVTLRSPALTHPA